MNPHEALHEALARLWKELPDLLGDAWDEVEAELVALLRGLEGDQPGEAEQRLFELFDGYPVARERLLTEMAGLTRPVVRGGGRRGAAHAAGERRERFTVVQVYYATDRAPTGKAGPRHCYGPDRGDGLRFGRLRVSIPDDHRMGRVERPRWWKLEFRVDPERHVVLLATEELSRDGFVGSARAGAERAERPEVLVFVHGYNVGFDAAARQTAQIAYDLQFPGVPMLYSWPSEGGLLKYTVDEANVRWSEPHFRDFLELCTSELGVTTVHVIAHSMGNRLLAETLGSVEGIGERPDQARLRQIVFAAPDVDADTFRQLAARFHERADRFTLYASSTDKALEASQKVHKYPRAGEAGEGLIVAPDIDTIDATAVDTSLLGHSYFGDNRSVISDLFNLVRDGRGPDRRFGLRRQKTPDGVYWLFRP